MHNKARRQVQSADSIVNSCYDSHYRHNLFVCFRYALPGSLGGGRQSDCHTVLLMEPQWETRVV